LTISPKDRKFWLSASGIVVDNLWWLSRQKLGRVWYLAWDKGGASVTIAIIYKIHNSPVGVVDCMEHEV